MNISPDKTRIGWIGAGVMGASMAGHLLDAGYKVTLYNRTKAKAEPLIERGANWVDRPVDVAKAADVVFLMVSTPEDVRQTVFGDEVLQKGGVLAGAKTGAVVVDMTTSEPSLAVEMAEKAAVRQIAFLDAPVSGGDVGAREATLSIMIGGDEAAFESLQPIWKILGSTYIHQGGPGAGQHTKMVNQTLVAGVMISTCEALLYAYKAGLDLETVLKSIATGAAGSWTLSNLGPRIIAGDFAPGFLIEHFLKDMRIALAEAKQMKISLPGLALCEQLYRGAAAQGHAKDGTHALMLSLAEMSGIAWGAKAEGGKGKAE